MSKVLIVNTRAGTGGPQTTHFSPCNQSRNSWLAEASAQRRFRTTGRLSNLWLRFSANSLNGATTFKSRVNTADGALSISVSAGVSGTFEDASNSDTIAATDLVALQFVAGGSAGTFTIQQWAVLFNSDAHCVDPIGDRGGDYITASTTLYSPLIGGGTYAVGTATESDIRQQIHTSGKLKNLWVHAATNGRSSSTTFRVRVNGADVNLTLSIGAAATGIFEDTSNTDAVVSGDELSLSITTGTGTGTLPAGNPSVSLETANGQFALGSGIKTAVSIADGVTRYAGFSSETVETTTESNVSVKSLAPFVINNAWVRIAANATTSTSTFDLRKNQASSALTVSIASGTTGEFSDTVNSVQVAATDELNMRFVNGGGGAMTYSAWTVQLRNPLAGRLLLLGVGV